MKTNQASSESIKTPLPAAFINFAGTLHDRFGDEYEYENPAEYAQAWAAFCAKQNATGTFAPKRRGSVATVELGGIRYTLKVGASRITETRERINARP